ncbi:pancreatic polypeptide-like [Passer domesticus]|uniref:pancreatic polypeptide-like n=2 Tax=Passer TaxID=9159 RepID=UPI0030FEDF03
MHARSVCGPPCPAPLPCDPGVAVAAMAPLRPPLLLLACAVLALLPLRPRAAPAQPAYPGDDAPVEELLRFYNDLQQYLNVVTRPRYGKRAGGRALGQEPLGAPGC